MYKPQKTNFTFVSTKHLISLVSWQPSIMNSTLPWGLDQPNPHSCCKAIQVNAGGGAGYVPKGILWSLIVGSDQACAVSCAIGTHVHVPHTKAVNALWAQSCWMLQDTAGIIWVFVLKCYSPKIRKWLTILKLSNSCKQNRTKSEKCLNTRDMDKRWCILQIPSFDMPSWQGGTKQVQTQTNCKAGPVHFSDPIPFYICLIWSH